MAHYAFLDENNTVVEVIVGRNEDEIVDGISDWESHYSEVRGLRCLRTSYNTVFNSHINGGSPYRGNYAIVGGTYNEERDIFLPPKPYPSYILDETILQWKAPVDRPEVEGKSYVWDEDSINWYELPPMPDASLAWQWNHELKQWVEY